MNKIILSVYCFQKKLLISLGIWYISIIVQWAGVILSYHSGLAGQKEKIISAVQVREYFEVEWCPESYCFLTNTLFAIDNTLCSHVHLLRNLL